MSCFSVGVGVDVVAFVLKSEVLLWFIRPCIVNIIFDINIYGPSNGVIFLNGALVFFYFTPNIDRIDVIGKVTFFDTRF